MKLYTHLQHLPLPYMRILRGLAVICQDVVPTGDARRGWPSRTLARHRMYSVPTLEIDADIWGNLMPLDKQSILKQIDDVLQKSNLISPHRYDDFSDLPHEQRSEAINLLYSAIDRLAPSGSPYVQKAKLHERVLTGNSGLALSPLRGILKAIRSDYEAGYTQSVVELVRADVFADFLDMADYLIEQNYKDPAAVIVGSVLEEHLRKLCQKKGLEILKPDGSPKKADTLNAELTSANVYSKLELKNVTAWLDLRNKAAHGHYTEYQKEHVDLMLQGVRDFATRYPA
jgi:hypothetical protein